MPVLFIRRSDVLRSGGKGKVAVQEGNEAFLKGNKIMPQTIYGTFADPANAERAAGALLDYGVKAEDLSVVANAEYRFKRLTAHDIGPRDQGRLGGEAGSAVLSAPPAPTAAGTTGPEFRTQNVPADSRPIDIDESERIENAAKRGISVTTGQDAAAGAAKGAGIGLGVGVLAGIAALAVPGIGTVAGTGLLASAIGTAIAGAVGTTAGGAIAGGVAGYLKDQGVEGSVADRYNQTVIGGGALLAVSLPSNNVDVATGQALLEKYGASNITNF